MYTSAAPTELVRPACSTLPRARNLSPLATPVILMVKSSVATAHPCGSSDRQDDTAATSPAAPTIDAGNCPGGPEKRSSNGSSITTSPGAAEETRMGYSRTKGNVEMKDWISLASRLACSMFSLLHHRTCSAPASDFATSSIGAELPSTRARISDP